MTTAAAADFLGINTSRVRQLAREGKLPAIKEETPRGPVFWFEPAELEAFRQRRAEESERRKGQPGRPLKLPPGEGGSAA